ncbi:hypothetical protein [Nostoc sp.]|nr:hypothetical protein [Nostoc sp.]
MRSFGAAIAIAAQITYEKDYVLKFANYIRAFPTKDARNVLQIRD